jgi:putative drug exporter of the RND superfamily
MARVSPARIGRWSIRRPSLALGAWLGFVVCCVALGALTGTKTLSNGAVGESARGYAVMDANDLWGPARELAYLHSDTVRVASPTFSAAIRDVRRRFAALGLATRTTLSTDGRSAIVVAPIDRPVALGRIQATIAAAARAHGGIEIAETGDLSADQARQHVVDRDLHRAELLAIPVTLVVLLLAFGSLVAALVPLLLGLTAVVAGVGLLGPLSQVFPVQDSAKTVILLLGLAVGVDYALFYVVRAREERVRGGSRSAVETAARTSGRTVLVSGATVAVAMAGMFLVRAKVLNGIAAGTIAVVVCAVAGSITVLPAVLELLGPRIERGRIPLLPPIVRPGGGHVWSAIAARVLRHPVLAACLSAGLLVALAIPALSLHVAKPSDLALTAQNAPALRALADVRRAFPQSGEPALVTLRVPASSREAASTRLRRLRSLALRSGLAHSPAAIRASADGAAAVLELPLAGNGANSASRDAVETLRRTLVPETLGRVPGAEVAVTGQTAEDVDFTRQIRSSLPFVIGFVLALAFCVLLVAFRSVVVPLKAVVLNLLSVGAAYGVLALVFEHHWAEPLLGFRSNGTIVAWLPLFLFVVLFGLSMDYHVFVLSRVREAVDRGQTTEQALRESIAATAGVVTAAALVMVCVFSLFGTLSSLDVKQAGVGLAVAVLLDATVVRAVLLPASMKLLDERNWYVPRFLGRFLSHPLPTHASIGATTEGRAT